MNLDTTSCQREVGEVVRGGCFQGGPLWLQQASAAPAVIPHPPTIYKAPSSLSSSQPVTGVADWLTAGLSHQMAGMPSLWDWSGSGLGGAHPFMHPQGG